MGDTRVYPSHEEAEYTAVLAFAIAVSASWWAVRVGRAQLQVPRMPAFFCHGRRDHWLQLDARVFREWAITPLALTLGLTHPDRSEAARVPTRKRVPELFDPVTKKLPQGCVYVGRGHHSHRIPTTKWKAPLIPGHHCSPEEWISGYIEHVCNTFWDDLPELLGKTLVCDCPLDVICEVDILAGLVFDATRPSSTEAVASPKGSGAKKPSGKAMMSAILSGRVVHISGCPVPQQWFTQEATVLAFKKLFPATWFHDFQFPLVEDLLNTTPFVDYLEWRIQQQMSWEGPFIPLLASPSIRMAQRTAEGQQAGALSHRAALPPLLSFGLDPEVHFIQAHRLSQLPLPTEQRAVLDEDLQFAAWCTANWRGQMRERRQHALGPLRELKRRWAPVSTVLVKHQPEAIRRVTAQRDLGLLSLLLLITSWSDTAYPHGLIRGLPAVAFAPPYGVFPLQEANLITFEDVLTGWEAHNKSILGSLKPGKDDDFLLSQSMADADQGFCSPPLNRKQFLGRIRNQPHRLIPRCVITQSSGKQRIIDNADSGGQSALSADSNKLVLCSPLRVARHVAATHCWMSPAALQEASMSDAWETGGEDWPNAYRHSPMAATEALCCVVTFWHHQWGEPAYQLYTGLLFGLPLAVTSFNRYSRLIEALGRRFCFVLTSMYFDDATISDWASNRGSGQHAFSFLNQLLGTPFADDKRQLMAPSGTVLGLDHDLSLCLSRGVVSFWARERLQSKLQDIITQCRSQGTLHPGTAAKLYGLANFFEQGIWGRVGAGGLAAIKCRQYSATHSLSPAILSCFEVLEAIISCQPKRELEVLPMDHNRFCVASDAALEQPRAGTGGFLIIWHDIPERREAFIAYIDDSLYDLWGPGDKKIAQLEMMMVLYSLLARPSMFRGRRGLWFIDNVAALMCLIRGRSDNPDLEKIANMIHIALFTLQCWCFWEWIPSKSNWSDSISRLGAADPWYQRHGFSLFTAFFPSILWFLPLRCLISVFEFL